MTAPDHRGDAAAPRPARLAFLAAIFLIAACGGGSVSGAAGNQVNRMGGTGMPRGGGTERDSNGGGGGRY